MSIFNNLAKLPTWSLFLLIITTVVLSGVILARIWFPEVIDTDIFWKIVLTYLVIIASSAVIGKIADLIKHINTEETKPKQDDGHRF